MGFHNCNYYKRIPYQIFGGKTVKNGDRKIKRNKSRERERQKKERKEEGEKWKENQLESRLAEVQADRPT